MNFHYINYKKIIINQPLDVYCSTLGSSNVFHSSLVCAVPIQFVVIHFMLSVHQVGSLLALILSARAILVIFSCPEHGHFSLVIVSTKLWTVLRLKSSFRTLGPYPVLSSWVCVINLRNDALFISFLNSHKTYLCCFSSYLVASY